MGVPYRQSLSTTFMGWIEVGIILIKNQMLKYKFDPLNFLRFYFRSLQFSKFYIYSIKAFHQTFVKNFLEKEFKKYFSIIN